MSLKSLARRVGLGVIADALETPTVDDIEYITALAINEWALKQSSIHDVPFPAIAQNDQVLNDAFDIPENSWEWVLPYQRQFCVKHLKTGIASRWINGRLYAQETYRKKFFEVVDS